MSKFAKKLVLFRNADYLAINKPIGIECTSGKEISNDFRSLLNSIGGSLVPVNSLGADLSGVVLLSRNVSAGRLARGLIKSGHSFQCKYWGILNGRPNGKHCQGIINIPLLGNLPNSNGTTAITHWKLLKYSNYLDGKEASLIEFEPRTDVANQIRLHCESSFRLQFVDNNMLHLQQIKTHLPNGEETTIEAPPIGVFEEFMSQLGWN